MPDIIQATSIPEPQSALRESELKSEISNLPEAQVRQVIDGDTVTLSISGDLFKVRLDSIDCPEDGQYWGDIAKYGLIKMIGGKCIRLEKHGVDHHGRMLATIFTYDDQKSEWMNVNERMVTLGHAWVMRRFYNHLPICRKTKLNRLENWSKAKKIGLWHQDDPLPPWKWRHNE